MGIKQKNQLVLNDPIPLSESAKGVVRIATNKNIPLIVDGFPDAVFEKDIGGAVVIKAGWYAALVDCWNSSHKIKISQIK